MKKILLATLMLSYILAGCAKDENESLKQDVSFSLDYTFEPIADAMSRAASSEAAADYQSFYNSYIKTKVLVHKMFRLNIDNSKGVNVQSITGRWNEKRTLILPEGEYTITGYSLSPYNNGSVDSLQISFNEKITISPATQKITLTAGYSCYLLLFNNNNIKSMTFIPTSGSLVNMGFRNNLYYAFSNEPSYLIRGTWNNNDYFSLKGILFDIGKYYYFKAIDNSFDIPEMASGF